MNIETSSIHFATGNKPWKYTFAPCAKEWYQYYLQSPYDDKPFKRYGRWGIVFTTWLILSDGMESMG